MHVVVVAAAEGLPSPDVDEVENFPGPVPELLVESIELFRVVLDNISEELFVSGELTGGFIPSEPDHDNDHEG